MGTENVLVGFIKYTVVVTENAELASEFCYVYLS